MMQIVWLKWSSDDKKSKDYGVTFWKLRDISKYEFKTYEHNGYYRQYLQYNWKSEDGHGTEEIDLKDYPRLSSKNHLILFCDIERPYIKNKNDIIEGPHFEKYIVDNDNQIREFRTCIY